MTTKKCERCGAPFECMPENIAACGCSAVPVTPEVRAMLAARYGDCLCADCLRAAVAEVIHIRPRPTEPGP